MITGNSIKAVKLEQNKPYQRLCDRSSIPGGGAFSYNSIKERVNVSRPAKVSDFVLTNMLKLLIQRRICGLSNTYR